MKKLISIFLTVLLLFISLPFTSFAVEEKAEENAFAGKRQMVFTIDYSDLNNYFNGGRTAFDLILRSHTPTWLTYSLSTNDRDVHLSMEFSFVSLDDYCQKISELIADTAYVSYYNHGKDFFLVEAHHTTDYLKFIYRAVADTFIYENVALQNLFHLSQNTLVVNGKEFAIGDKVTILPEGESIVLLSELSIETTYVDGVFQRNITASPQKHEEFERLLSHFEMAGLTETTESGAVYVAFSATSMAELNRLTFRCLYTACSIEESEEQLDGITVRVRCSEQFDLDVLLEKNGRFSYAYTYPDYYRNVKSVEELQEGGSESEETESAVEIDNGTIRTTIKRPVTYVYERDFLFSGVDVKTDLTHGFGKIKKAIAFRAPRGRAILCHDALKKLFEKQMYAGVALNIRDEGGNRYYELSYSSWFASDVEEFSKKILGKSYSCTLSDSWLPYGKSTICEEIQRNEFSLIGIPPTTWTATYEFSDGASFSGEKKTVVRQEDNTLVVAVSDDAENKVEYHRFNWTKCIVLSIGLIVVVISVLIVWKCRKRILERIKIISVEKVEQRKQQKELRRQQREEEVKQLQLQQEAEAQRLQEEYRRRQQVVQEQPDNSLLFAPIGNKKFCPQCGKLLATAGEFCGQCGAKIE